MDEQRKPFNIKLCSQLEIFNEDTQLIKATTYEENGKIYLELTVIKRYNPDQYGEEFKDKEFVMCIPKICLNNICFSGLNEDDCEVITITLPRRTLDNYKNTHSPYLNLKDSGLI